MLRNILKNQKTKEINSTFKRLLCLTVNPYLFPPNLSSLFIVFIFSSLKYLAKLWRQTKKTNRKKPSETFVKTRNQKSPVCYLSPLFFRKPRSKKSPLETFVKIPKEKSSVVYSLLNQFSKNRKNPFAQPSDWAYIASQLTNWSSSTTGIDSLNANSPRALESAMDSQLLTKPICAFVCNCECVYVTRVKNVNTVSDKVGVEMAGVCRINSLAKWRTWAKLTFMDPG